MIKIYEIIPSFWQCKSTEKKETSKENYDLFFENNENLKLKKVADKNNLDIDILVSIENKKLYIEEVAIIIGAVKVKNELFHIENVEDNCIELYNY